MIFNPFVPAVQCLCGMNGECVQHKRNEALDFCCSQQLLSDDEAKDEPTLIDLSKIRGYLLTVVGF